MMMLKNKIITCLLVSTIFISVSARDILVEAKGAVFVPTNEAFKAIYHNCGDAGLEITGNLFDHLYGFVSTDLVVKTGHTVGFDSPTKVIIVNLGIGLKYFLPFNHGDFYIGLGIEPTYFCTLDDSPFVSFKNDQWSCGALGKVGVIFDLPNSFFTDIFLNYSFVDPDRRRLNDISFYSSSAQSPTQSNNVSLNGWSFGVGIGYRFN